MVNHSKKRTTTIVFVVRKHQEMVERYRLFGQFSLFGRLG